MINNYILLVPKFCTRLKALNHVHYNSEKKSSIGKNIDINNTNCKAKFNKLAVVIS